MKRIFSLLMIIVLVFTLAACSNPDEGAIVVPEGMKNPLALYDDNDEIVVALGMTQEEVEEKLGEGVEEEPQIYGTFRKMYEDILIDYSFRTKRVTLISTESPKYQDYVGVRVGDSIEKLIYPPYSYGDKIDGIINPNSPLYNPDDLKLRWVSFDKDLQPMYGITIQNVLEEKPPYSEMIGIRNLKIESIRFDVRNK